MATITVKKMREALKEEVVVKYERLKHRAVEAHEKHGIDDEGLRLRKKMLKYEANRRLEEIEKLSADKVRERYAKLITK